MADYCKGMYGTPPGKIAPELMEKALKGKKPDTSRPGSRLAPGLEKARQDAGPLAKSEEDVLTYALFPEVAKTFLQHKYNA